MKSLEDDVSESQWPLYVGNLLLVLLLTPILAVLVAWIVSELAAYSVRVVRYQQFTYPYFELIFVNEALNSDPISGFTLHPMLFEMDYDTFSAEINGNTVTFSTNRDSFFDVPCDATVSGTPIKCEERSHFADPHHHFFVDLTGDLGISEEQANQLNAPHRQFDDRLGIFRDVMLYLFPFTILVWIYRIFMNELTWLQLSGLYIPWVAGMLFWIYWVWGRASLFAFFRG